MASVEDFDPFAPETLECPYPFYAALRRDAPLYELPGGDWSVVSRFEDCQRVAMEPARFSSRLVAFVTEKTSRATGGVETAAGGPTLVDVLAIADDPDHARQRKLTNKAFSMRRVAALEDDVRALVDRLIDGFAEEGRADWMATVAAELPTQMICRLVGFPLEDGGRLRTWAFDGSALLSGVNTSEDFARLGRSMIELSHYLAARVEDARHAPGDDVLGDLVRATAPGDESLDENEVVSILVQLLGAGTESTNALLGSALWLLLEHPDVCDALRRDPALIPAFVEEALRLESPFQGHFRLALEDAEIAGAKVRAGSRLMLLWGSANRDERVFERPDEMDLERPNPRSHLAFGFGAHHCIGAQLARLETRVALEQILARTSSLRLAGGAAPTHVPSMMMRRLERLTIELEPAD